MPPCEGFACRIGGIWSYSSYEMMGLAMSDFSPVVQKSAGIPSIPVHPVEKSDLSRTLELLEDHQRTFLNATGFSGKPGETALLPDQKGNLAAVLFGLGNSETGMSHAPLQPGMLARQLPGGRYHFGSTQGVDQRLAAIAFAMASYRFDRYRADDQQPHPQWVVDDPALVDDVMRINSGVTLARDLINMPANDLGPAELADAAVQLARQHGAQCHRIAGPDLERDFPLVEAVGRASDRPPCLVDMKWGNPDAPKVTLVGKGVIFDTGGLDIKPPPAMAIMKKDMGGAANVLGLSHMIMASGLPVRLRVLIPAVENAISGSAFRPGDILKSRKGLNVEIGNTDAEGRLVLADALSMASDERPDLIVSMATLTGAARIALGPDLPPLYTHDDQLAISLAQAAQGEADPFWRLPLWSAYNEWLSSPIADVNHIGSTPFAGSIVAALFLGQFVDRACPFAHFDIYAWNQKGRHWGPRGGEAQAIRAVFQAISDRYSNS